ncbi:hypothetical protein Leryth_016623, partial [Lithospermum erythrorhizon]
MGRLRKRVEAEVEVEVEESAPTGLKRAKDGSAFTKCDECKKDVPVALISFHSCSLDAKIKMNLDALVVEGPTDTKKKPSERRKPKLTEPKAKKEKKEKDPNAPKRPRTAFFVFLDDFRKEFTEANPDSKKGSIVAKEAGEKWKSMTDEEKKPYSDKAAELKAEYDKAVESPQGSGDDDVEEESPNKAEKETINVDEEDELAKAEKESVDDEVCNSEKAEKETAQVNRNRPMVEKSTEVRPLSRARIMKL